MSRRQVAVSAYAFFLFALLTVVSWAARSDRFQTPSERRQVRLTRHLKRLARPGDWRIVHKLFSSDRTRQLEGLENCRYPETEWPWYLSSGHLERYAFTVDFIPVNMDSDPEDETLIVVQSDLGAVNYATFCLVDDEKRGRTPLSSYSEISHDRPITFQLVDLTGGGESELIIYTRDDRAGLMVDSVRIIKLNGRRRFDLVWFGRLRGKFVWPPEKEKAKKRTIIRSETLKAKMRLNFNGVGNPATIVLKGERHLWNRIRLDDGTWRQSRRKILFEERWRWNKKRFRFIRIPDFE